MDILSVIRVLMLLAIAFIGFVTVAPIRFRPKTITTPQIDRFAAFFVAGFLTVASLPSHALTAAGLIVIAAGASEILQLLSVTRHARLRDACAKACGAGVGALVGLLAF